MAVSSQLYDTSYHQAPPAYPRARSFVSVTSWFLGVLFAFEAVFPPLPLPLPFDEINLI